MDIFAKYVCSIEERAAYMPGRFHSGGGIYAEDAWYQNLLLACEENHENRFDLNRPVRCIFGLRNEFCSYPWKSDFESFWFSWAG